MMRRPRPPQGLPIRRLLGLAIMVVGLVIGLAFCFRSDVDILDAEARYDGVHLCSPKQREKLTSTPSSSAPVTVSTTTGGSPTLSASPAESPTQETPTASASPGETGGAEAQTETSPPGTVPAASGTPPLLATPVPQVAILSLLGGEGSDGPFFSQTSPIWGSDEYDHGYQQEFWCGAMISQCGCAMTSIATVLAMFRVATDSDGLPLNPRVLNNWFNRDAQLTTGGWVSQGYVYGNVMWTSANAFSAAVAEAFPGTPTVRFSRWGLGTEEEIRAELVQGRPVILEVPGHFIAAVGLDGDEILINDPYYRDRQTLSAYAGRVINSRLFETSADLSALVISVPSNLRVQITDSQGRVTGTLQEGTSEKAQDAAKEDIPGATYRFEEAWRDPSCTERPPEPGTGINTIVIAKPIGESYHVEVVNPDGGPTTVAIHSYDEDGDATVITRDSPGNDQFDVTQPADGAPVVEPPPRTPRPPLFRDETDLRLPLIADDSLDFDFGDIDGDGDLDIVTANDRFIFPLTPLVPPFPLVTPRVPPEEIRNVDLPRPLLPDLTRILINNDGKFSAQNSLWLPPDAAQSSLAVELLDIDGDGDEDLFILNDASTSQLLLNNGSRFVNV